MKTGRKMLNALGTELGPVAASGVLPWFNFFLGTGCQRGLLYPSPVGCFNLFLNVCLGRVPIPLKSTNQKNRTPILLHWQSTGHLWGSPCLVW